MKTKLFSIEIWKFILPLMFLCYISKSKAQCSPDVLVLLTQADVDNFGVTYPSVTDWDGSIKIGEDDSTSNITNLNGLSNLESICGYLNISFNPSLPNLIGLENLTNLGDLFITSNPSLENIDALLSLTSANFLQISLNDILDNLNGLSNLATVTSTIVLEGPNLTDLDGLQNLTSVGEMQIPGGNILNINGLSNLLSAETLWLHDFNYLENLSGLENLISLKRLEIDFCPMLISIDALANVDFLDYDPEVDPDLPYVIVYNNPLLGECSIAPLCDKITDPDFVFFVEGNAIGCESIEAVIDGCNLGATEVSLNSIKIFPNPSNSIVNISGNNITQVKIFDVMGRKLLDAPIENNSFNVEKLASGRYVAQLIGNGGGVIMESLIVE